MTSRFNAVDKIIDHVHSHEFEHLSAEAIVALKTFILDSIGVGISGSRLPFAPKLIALSESWGRGEEAQVWCTGEWLPAPSAAAINAWQLHNQEFDCIHEAAVVHPMAVILPSLLAYSQKMGKVDGRSLLTAVSIAVDIATTLGEASCSPLRFFRPAICGALGATMGLSKLAGLSDLQTRNALGIIYSQISGTMQAHTEGSPMLAMQMLENTRCVLTTIDMALAGVEAPHDVIEGPFGFYSIIEPKSNIEPESNINAIFKQLGQVSQITRVSHKPFPTGRACHGGLDALMVLQNTYQFTASDVVKGELQAPPLIEHLTGRRPTPTMPTSYARLCFPYSAATYLLDGDVGVTCYDDDKLRNAERLALAEKFTVTISDCKDPNAMVPQKLILSLKDGRQIEQIQAVTLGSPERPLSREQHLKKFRQCCIDAIAPLKTSAIEHLITSTDSLEQLSDVSVLTQLATESYSN